MRFQPRFQSDAPSGLRVPPLPSLLRPPPVCQSHWQNVSVQRWNLQASGFWALPHRDHAFLVPLQAPLHLAAQIGSSRFDWDMRQAEGAIIPAGMLTEWHCSDRIIGDTLQMYLRPAFVKHTIESCGLQWRNTWLEPEVGVKDDRPARLGLMLLEKQSLDGPMERLFADSLTIALTVCLLRAEAVQHLDQPLRKGGLPVRHLQRVTDYVQGHLDRNISLQELADVTGLSAYHFARLFREAAGQTPHQYVLTQRINKAKQLLDESKLSILEICQEAGFESQSHFTKVFHRQTGITPKNYRNLL